MNKFIPNVDPYSMVSLKIEPHFNDVLLSNATGFLIEYMNNCYLVTNWHVVSGRNADTLEILDRKNAAIPNKLKIKFHAGVFGSCQEKFMDLFDSDNNPLWIQHPKGHTIDIVLLKINKNEFDEKIRFYCFDPIYLSQVDMVVRPSESVSIIGFPLGLSCGGIFPIWKTGHVASDIDVDLDEKRPAFLIDATTKSGMSGSPVFFRSNNYESSKASINVGCGISTRFLGVYSGRIHEESDVGRVWKPFLIEEILNTLKKDYSKNNWVYYSMQ